LMPFYAGQENDSACSSAALVTVLNGARHGQPLTDQDELVTHKSLTEKYTDPAYAAAVSGDGGKMKDGEKLGVSVERLAEVLKESVEKLKLPSPASKVELVTIDGKKKEA